MDILVRFLTQPLRENQTELQLSDHGRRDAEERRRSGHARRYGRRHGRLLSPTLNLT